MSRNKLSTILLIIVVLCFIPLFMYFLLRSNFIQNPFADKKEKSISTSGEPIVRETLFGKYINNSSKEGTASIDYRGFTDTDKFFSSNVHILGLTSDCKPIDYSVLSLGVSKSDAIVASHDEMRAALDLKRDSVGVTYASGITVPFQKDLECTFVFSIKDGLHLIGYQHRDGHYEVVNVN